MKLLGKSSTLQKLKREYILSQLVVEGQEEDGLQKLEQVKYEYDKPHLKCKDLLRTFRHLDIILQNKKKKNYFQTTLALKVIWSQNIDLHKNIKNKQF